MMRKIIIDCFQPERGNECTSKECMFKNFKINEHLDGFKHICTDAKQNNK